MEALLEDEFFHIGMQNFIWCWRIVNSGQGRL
jgi:hypothetical protein